MQRSIHVVTNHAQAFWTNYLVALLAWHWTQAGHRVTNGPVRAIESHLDLAILHIDRTRIDAGMVPRNDAKRPFLNRGVLDISKRLFSTLITTPGDSWEGAVIIKSNLNCYGEQEWQSRHHGFVERQRRNLSERSWRLARRLPPRTYPILPKLSEVPDWVWENPEYIVERFLPERDLDRYCLRGWVFFGRRGYTYRLFSDEPIVKARAAKDHEFLGDPPAELRCFRELNNWDFGKFDYVVVDGQPILLDINKTPVITTGPDTPRLRNLAEGLDEVVEAAL